MGHDIYRFGGRENDVTYAAFGRWRDILVAVNVLEAPCHSQTTHDPPHAPPPATSAPHPKALVLERYGHVQTGVEVLARATNMHVMHIDRTVVPASPSPAERHCVPKRMDEQQSLPDFFKATVGPEPSVGAHCQNGLSST